MYSHNLFLYNEVHEINYVGGYKDGSKKIDERKKKRLEN